VTPEDRWGIGVGGGPRPATPGARRHEGRIHDARHTRSSPQTRIRRQLPQRLRPRGIVRAAARPGVPGIVRRPGGIRPRHVARGGSAWARLVSRLGPVRARTKRTPAPGSRARLLRAERRARGDRRARGEWCGAGGGRERWGGFGTDLGFRAGARARVGRRSVDRRADGGRASLVGAGVVVPGHGPGGRGAGAIGLGPMGRRDRSGIPAVVRASGSRRVRVGVPRRGPGGISI